MRDILTAYSARDNSAFNSGVISPARSISLRSTAIRRSASSGESERAEPKKNYRVADARAAHPFRRLEVFRENPDGAGGDAPQKFRIQE